jgi:hypothetical protein
MMEEPVTARNWVAAGVGFAVALVIIVAVQWFSLQQSRGAESSVRRLVYEAERTTYLIGDVGQLLSQLQVNLAESVMADRSSLASSRARFQRIDEGLQAHADELPSLLSPEEDERWRAIDPEIKAIRASLAVALDLAESGEGAGVEAWIAAMAGRTELFESVHSLLELNQVGTRAQLRAASDLLVRRRLIHDVVAVLELMGVAAIGLIAIRVMRSKDDEIAVHLQRIARHNDELVTFAGRVAHELPLYFTALRHADQSGSKT